jgi:hypothetical protein
VLKQMDADSAKRLMAMIRERVAHTSEPSASGNPKPSKASKAPAADMTGKQIAVSKPKTGTASAGASAASASATASGSAAAAVSAAKLAASAEGKTSKAAASAAEGKTSKAAASAAAKPAASASATTKPAAPAKPAAAASAPAKAAASAGPKTEAKANPKRPAVDDDDAPAAKRARPTKRAAALAAEQKPMLEIEDDYDSADDDDYVDPGSSDDSGDSDEGSDSDAVDFDNLTDEEDDGDESIEEDDDDGERVVAEAGDDVFDIDAAMKTGNAEQEFMAWKAKRTERRVQSGDYWATAFRDVELPKMNSVGALQMDLAAANMTRQSIVSKLGRLQGILEDAAAAPSDRKRTTLLRSAASVSREISNAAYSLVQRDLPALLQKASSASELDPKQVEAIRAQCQAMEAVATAAAQEAAKLCPPA